MSELRYYKGKFKVEIQIKGKRKGNHGPITYLCKALEDIKIESSGIKGYFFVEISKGEEFTTIPRLLWKQPKIMFNGGKIK